MQGMRHKASVVLVSVLVALSVTTCSDSAQPVFHDIEATVQARLGEEQSVEPTPVVLDIEATVQARLVEERAVEATVEARAQVMAKGMVAATAQAAPAVVPTRTPKPTAPPTAAPPSPTYSPTPTHTPTPTPSVFRMLWYDPPTLDPHLAADSTSARIVNELFSGLVALDTDL